MQLNGEVGLQCQKISHPKKAGVNRGRMFNLESPSDGPSFDPDYINLLDGAHGHGFIVEGKLLKELAGINIFLSRNLPAVAGRDPNLVTERPAELCERGLDL